MTLKDKRVTSNLTADDVRKIRRAYAASESMAEVAAALGISVRLAFFIANRQSWKHVTAGPGEGSNPIHGGAGERHHNSKLTADEVRTIRAMVAAGITMTVVARIYDVHTSHVSRICSRQVWASVK